MDGILAVDKPSGITSHDVVDLIRNRFRIKKVGHAGTLDPMATGVLVMLLGSYTRRSAELMANDKEYVATMVLGSVSDTGDKDGRIEVRDSAPHVTREAFDRVLGEFTGHIEQIPPMYSALKINGRKMYELARRGIEVERPARRIQIHTLSVISFDPPKATFSVVCSKGTYVRQLAADIGDSLGCGAYLESLRRTRSGKFTINGCITLDQVKTMGSDDLLRTLVLS